MRFTIPGRPQRWMRAEIDPKTRRKYTNAKAEASKKMIAAEYRAAHGAGPIVPHTGPLVLTAIFVFAIPQSWPRYLREPAIRGEVWLVADPDLDQTGQTGHGCDQGLAYVDDNQIVGFDKCAKRYGGPERSDITLTPLRQHEAAVTPGQRRIESLPRRSPPRRLGLKGPVWRVRLSRKQTAPARPTWSALSGSPTSATPRPRP